MMKGKTLRLNIKHARELWGILPRSAAQSLRRLTTEYGLSVSSGDLQLLNGCWYVTHAGLLRISTRRHCTGIRTLIERTASDPTSGRWVFKAIVYKTDR